MKNIRFSSLITFLICFFYGCDRASSSKTYSPTLVTGEYIYRHHADDPLIQLEPVNGVDRDPYPWQESSNLLLPKITKDFFRCKGSHLNPVRMIQKKNELIRYYDCEGSQKHSLILRDGKEHIFPILLDLLNHIQLQTEKRVVITCGHCCPEHYLYLDDSPKNQASKHLIGAEVDFYVQEMEQEPQKIIDLIFAYYKNHPKYKDLKSFREFNRYEKGNTNVKINPWYNQEIFIKLMNKEEGRDFDNRHPYPYISLQVRYDWELKEPVSYSYNQSKNFHRW